MKVGLRSFSRYYRNHVAESEQDGYLRGPSVNGKKGPIIRHSNQEAIGRKHFATLNGNRLATHPEDGYNFRGRGLIQITGYEKYSGFMADYNQFWQGTAPDIVNHPDLVNQFPNSIRTAVWFWAKHAKTYLVADRGHGEGDLEDVTTNVNGALMGLAERRIGYHAAEAAFK
jgi:predicted chitinase